MLQIIKDWYQRNFSDPQVVILLIALLMGLGVILFLGDLLAPVLVSILFAYLLDGIVGSMTRRGIPRALAATIVLIVFVVLCLFLFFGLIPLLSQQISELFRQVPRMVLAGQEALMQLPERYPQLFTEEQMEGLLRTVAKEIGDAVQIVLSFSMANVVNLFAFAVYAVLVPLMVFFILKDKRQLMEWASQFLPQRRELSNRVWLEVDEKIANYIRGKFIEIAIVGGISYITFAFMGLDFSLLLGFLVGISVIIPYVGAVVVTFPVAVIAFFQWDITAQFWYLMLAYQVIQILDGNVLVPLLFSEVVNLHPLAIIIAVLFFGGLWGIWGVFFAIPLATLVNAVIKALPRQRQEQEEAEALAK